MRRMGKRRLIARAPTQRHDLLMPPTSTSSHATCDPMLPMSCWLNEECFDRTVVVSQLPGATKSLRFSQSTPCGCSAASRGDRRGSLRFGLLVKLSLHTVVYAAQLKVRRFYATLFSGSRCKTITLYPRPSMSRAAYTFG